MYNIMLLRNFKSTQDEVSKRSLADELLQVEINNNAILDERIGKYQDKNAPPPVPPEYKSQSEILKDTIKLERDAIDGVMDIGFSYGDASKIVSELKGNKQLIELVQGLPYIKSDIQKKFNPKLVSVSFFQGYLQNYFEELGVSYGFSFDKSGGMDIASLSEIKQILPQADAFQSLGDLVQTTPMSGEIGTSILIPIQNFLQVALTPAEETKLNTGNLTAKTRQGLFKRIKAVITKASIPSPVEIREASIAIQRAIDDGASYLAFNQIGADLANRLSGMTKVNLKPLESIANDINTELPDPDIEPQEVNIGVDDEDEEPMEILPYDEARFNINIKYIEGLIKRQDWRGMNNMIEQVLSKVGLDRVQSTDGTIISLASIEKENSGERKSRITLYKKAEGLIGLMREILRNRIGVAPYYNIDNHQYYEDPNDGAVGFGVKSKTAKAVKKHFKEDEKFLKKVAEEVADDSSSDEEVMKVLKKHSKTEKPYEAKIEKAVGAGYIHKRIPIKKIVGKGIDVEEQPTYRTFGKYVMHIPHLTDKNVLNLKYPSLGSIPSIKPMTISEDFKDFVIDVMNTGRVNEKQFNSLHPHEQRHFERISKGAGLIDTFKLKRSGDDEEKAEVDRFNLLRGNYLGGNNSPDVLKELKGLVVKFINDGRIARNEGLNLLMELSI
jgi:hypothetical protein